MRRIEEEDVIRLIHESERCFIDFAKQKLEENRNIIQERASKALENSRRREI